MNESLAKLQKAYNILWRAEGYLRLGQVIYANRQMGYLAPVLDGDEVKIGAIRRIVSRLRKGEQLDAHDEMKSLLDKIRNEIKSIEKSAESDSNPKNP